MTTTSRASALHLLGGAPLDTLSISSLLAERELRGSVLGIQRACHAHASYMPRLACDTVLEGHRGCVNHLRWNRSGSLLASGSDDHQVIVWDYASRTKREAIRTGHTGNIFAVCFVPETNDHIIASAAADCDVRVHYAPFRAGATKLFRVHSGRVKDIGTSWAVPKVFWSVAEDGVVYQFDVRALPRTDGRSDPHSSSSSSSSSASGVVVRLGRDRRGNVLRGMGMATHPLDATKFALACGDYYTRLFDHRMLRVTPARARSRSDASAASDATQPVEVFAPPHLHLSGFSDRRAKRRHDEAHGTSIQFSSDGAHVLANYHNDHIYLFRVDAHAHVGDSTTRRFDKPMQPNWCNGAHMDEAMRPLPLRASDVQTLFANGLAALEAQQYPRAVRAFATACSARALAVMAVSFRCELFHSCARAYLGRAWSSDAYLAAVYCKRALALVCDSTNANGIATRGVELTYIEALHADRRTTQCRLAAQAYAQRHREHADDVHRFLQNAPVARETDNQRAAPSTPPYDSGSDADDNADDDGEDGGDDDGSGEDFAISSAHSPADDNNMSDVDSEYNDGVGSDNESDKSARHSPEPSMTSAPQSDDEFWDAGDAFVSHVNCDVVRRYIGYCNNETDIKEAAFFGDNDAFIVAGSDDGRAYIWDTVTGRLVNAVVADETILNCVRPHPSDACLATSGIEDVIRLWSPTAESATAPSDDELEHMTRENQRKMLSDNWGFYFGGTERDVIRVVFQPAGREGAQECATS